MNGTRVALRPLVEMDAALQKIPFPLVIKRIANAKLYPALLQIAGKELSIAEAGTVLAEGMDQIKRNLKDYPDKVEFAFALCHMELARAMVADVDLAKEIFVFSSNMLHR
jgi:hypothetical protein